MEDLPSKEIAALLNRIAQGDDQAVRTLYQHYQRSVYAFIRHKVSNEAAAQEILNDTFLVMCQKPHVFNGSSKFHTWLCGIAKNKCLDWRRRQARQPVAEEIDEETLENVADQNWNILENLEKEEVDVALRACIDRLPETQREALHWAWYEDETVEVVGQRLGCPAGTVKSRLHHARLKIRDCIEKALGKGFRDD